MTVLLILIASVAVGLLLRRRLPSRLLDRSATATVWLLIFTFGISLGSNKAIVSDFPHFGSTAIIIAIAGVAGSVGAAWIVGHWLDNNNNSDKNS